MRAKGGSQWLCEANHKCPGYGDKDPYDNHGLFLSSHAASIMGVLSLSEKEAQATKRNTRRP